MLRRLKSMQLISLTSLVFTLLSVAFGIMAIGDDAPAKAAQEPKTIREFIDSSTSWYDVYPNADAEKPAKPIIVLRWANNARGSEDGTTLLYVHEGLPIATACAYPWEKRLEYSFQSLSRNKLVARRDATVIWQPQTPGVTFADIPKAPVPEATRPQRLRQMKALAERFQGVMAGWKPDASDREELRLLPRSLYRYEPKESTSPKPGTPIDGAVFAFVMGTDPEILLQIEAVAGQEQPKWQYAFSRRTSGALEGRLDKTVVWQAERFPVQTDPLRTYISLGTPLPPRLASEAAKQQEATP